MKKIKITNLKTGRVWVGNTILDFWNEVYREICQNYQDYNLLSSDIECLAKGNIIKKLTNNISLFDVQWYILDGRGRYMVLPKEYKVEEIKNE